MIKLTAESMAAGLVLRVTSGSQVTAWTSGGGAEVTAGAVDGVLVVRIPVTGEVLQMVCGDWSVQVGNPPTGTVVSWGSRS